MTSFNPSLVRIKFEEKNYFKKLRKKNIIIFVVDGKKLFYENKLSQKMTRKAKIQWPGSPVENSEKKKSEKNIRRHKQFITSHCRYLNGHITSIFFFFSCTLLLRYWPSAFLS